MHGKTSEIEVNTPTKIFDSLPSRFRATRYHSLVVNPTNLPSIVKPTAYSRDDHEIMALEVEGKPIFGVQFHPESIMSEFGYEIIDNFLKL